MAYGSGLENQRAATHRGFKSHPLRHYASVVELADTLDLGSGAERRESSNLSRRTNFDFCVSPRGLPMLLKHQGHTGFGRQGRDPRRSGFPLWWWVNQNSAGVQVFNILFRFPSVLIIKSAERKMRYKNVGTISAFVTCLK